MSDSTHDEQSNGPRMLTYAAVAGFMFWCLVALFWQFITQCGPWLAQIGD